MRGRSMSELRTAQNRDAAPNGRRGPADLSATGQISGEAELELANKQKSFPRREIVEQSIRQQSPVHGFKNHRCVCKERLSLQPRVGKPTKGPRKFPFLLRRRRPNA